MREKERESEREGEGDLPLTNLSNGKWPSTKDTRYAEGVGVSTGRCPGVGLKGETNLMRETKHNQR